MRILTFDIEEWFHILEHDETSAVDSWMSFESRIYSGVDLILKILDDKGARATFFCLGWIAEKYPSLIRRIVDNGHEVACHSMYHQLVYTHSRSSFAEDVRKSKIVLEDAGGSKIDTFRAPGFSITDQCLWAFEELVSAGYEVDCSIFPASRAHGGLREVCGGSPVVLRTNAGQSLFCLPMNVAKLGNLPFCYSGGGYFRLLPLGVIDYLMKRDPYVMTYFHPRDFDVEQPRVPGLSPFRRFKSYVGISGCENKLRFLLDTYEFNTVGDARSSIEWERVDTVSIGDAY